MFCVQPIRALALMSILVLLFAGHNSAHAADWELSALRLDAGNEHNTADLAVHWSGPLPVSLVAVRDSANGEFKPVGEAKTLRSEMSRVRAIPFDEHEILAVIGRDGRILATTALGEQDFGWQSQFVGPGLEGSVADMLVHDGDLIVAGRFDAAGHELASSIAKWDGSSWSGFGSDAFGRAPEFNGGVQALAVYDGSLIAAGRFTEIDGQMLNRIARWDGDGWRPLGSGSDNGVSGDMRPGVAIAIESLTVHNGELVVGGRFESAGGVAASHVARWDGASWSAVAGSGGEGVSPEHETGYSSVHALASYNGELVVGGVFDYAGGLEVSNLARWSNGVWQELPNGSGGQGSLPVLTMEAFGSDLVIGGDFFSGNAIVWDGVTLESLGLLSPMEDYRPRVLQDLTVMNGDLHAVGEFRIPFTEGLGTVSVARWTGTSWQPVEDADGDLPDAGVFAVAVFDDRLVVGGDFMGFEGRRFNSLAAHDGQQWQSLEPDGAGGIRDGAIYASTVWNGQLVVGGSFRWAGGRRVNHLARWDGVRWQGFPGDSGMGLGGGFEAVSVSEIEVFDGDLVVAGRFESAGGLPVRNIARYGAQGWSDMNVPAQYAGGIRALTRWNDQLVAPLVSVDEFDQVEATFVYAFDGSTWSRLHAAGAAGFGSGRVFHLESFGGVLYAGGSFLDVDGLYRRRLARYDGQAWQSLLADPAEGPSSSVRAMAVFNDELVVSARSFEVEGPNLDEVARWNGTAWKSLYNEKTRGWTTNGIDDLAVVNGKLYGVGTFASNAVESVTRIARYDGTDWAALHGPLDYGTGWTTTHVAAWNNQPLAGGSFDRAGGVPAWGLALHSLEPSSVEITGVEVATPGQWPLNSALVTARVDGLVTAPIDGKLTIESDQGEWCLTTEPLSAAGASLHFQCRIDYEGGGGRMLTAAFSASASHESSESPSVYTQARWPSQTSIVQTVPESEQAVGQPIEVVVAVTSDGTPTGLVIVELGTADQCEIDLPDDRCTLFASSAGQTNIDAYYVGDPTNQPSFDAIDFHIVPSGFEFAPQRLDFGSVGIGHAHGPLAMEITNVSEGTVQIMTIHSPTSPFQQVTGGSCLQPPFSLAVGQNCTLNYDFSPLSAQTYQSAVTIESDLPGSPHVFMLNGSGKDTIFKDAFFDENPGMP